MATQPDLNPSTLNVKGPKLLEKAGKIGPAGTPLDNLLAPTVTAAATTTATKLNTSGPTTLPTTDFTNGLSWQRELHINRKEPSLKELYESWADRRSVMFLHPNGAKKDEQSEALCIIDFVTASVLNEHEKCLPEMGTMKLLIKYGASRLKLESVSLPQWVVGNTRIFYHLLLSNKLPTQWDIRGYLGYTVKDMQLANKYDWVSVLHFNDEFCSLQALYGYPWSFDSIYLHQIILEPKQTHGSLHLGLGDPDVVRSRVGLPKFSQQ